MREIMSPRRAARTDANQTEIVMGLYAHFGSDNISVQSLAMVGAGCPDILVGIDGLNILLEVKDGEKCESRRELTEYQRKWHKWWRGSVVKVSSLAEAIEVIGGMRG